MTHLIPDRPHLPDGLDGSQPSSSASSPPRRGALSHRRAREQLALVLDPTTEAQLLEALHAHVAGCPRCRQELDELRQAEAWFLAQPVEAPQMVAAQDAVWAAIQARLAATGALALPASNGHLRNGHLRNGHRQAALNGAQPAIQSPVLAEPGAAASAAEEAAAPASQDEPAALPGADTQVVQPAAEAQEPVPASEQVVIAPAPSPALPTPLSLRAIGKTAAFTPMKVLVAVLAASFLMSSLALLVVHFTTGPDTSSMLGSPTAPPLADILNPGDATLALDFDPLSRRLFALSSEVRAACHPLPCHSPFDPVPSCLSMSSLDADTGRLLWSLLPACMSGLKGASVDAKSATFSSLFEDTALGQVALLDNAGQVVTVNTRTDTPGASYPLACCAAAATQAGTTLLDGRDHLLLTAAVTRQGSALQTLAAQNVTTGQMAYQMPLDGGPLQGAILSASTGWLYLWTGCATAGAASCVEAYLASDGQKVGGWLAPAHSTPLAADPANNMLYVREETPDGLDATLVLDGRSGAPVATLPPAQAIAFNGPLHHAYLLDDNGVTVVDTRSRRTLSMLPVLAHDGARWAEPAVDERYDRVYLPTLRGKIVTAQDDPAGHLRLPSPTLQATLDAERAMIADWMAEQFDLDPADLPVGPGAFTFYYPLEQAQPSGCQPMPVPARTQSQATPLGGGDYSVTISLSWTDSAGHAALSTPQTSPPPQANYPHQHTWLYRIPASGGAQWASEQGESLPRC